MSAPLPTPAPAPRALPHPTPAPPLPVGREKGRGGTWGRPGAGWWLALALALYLAQLLVLALYWVGP